MITATQSRMARAGLKWSLDDLEAATGLSKTTLRRFEVGGEMRSSMARRIQAVLERYGVFFFDGGVAIESEALFPRSAGPPWPPPLVGCIIKQHLARLGMNQAQLAAALGLSRPRTNFLLNGRCSITPEIALRLGKVFEAEPEDWMWMQIQIDLSKARRKLEKGEAQSHASDSADKLQPIYGVG